MYLISILLVNSDKKTPSFSTKDSFVGYVLLYKGCLVFGHITQGAKSCAAFAQIHTVPRMIPDVLLIHVSIGI